jgi:hypothetical protein
MSNDTVYNHVIDIINNYAKMPSNTIINDKINETNIMRMLFSNSFQVNNTMVSYFLKYKMTDVYQNLENNVKYFNIDFVRGDEGVFPKSNKILVDLDISYYNDKNIIKCYFLLDLLSEMYHSLSLTSSMTNRITIRSRYILENGNWSLYNAKDFFTFDIIYKYTPEGIAQYSYANSNDVPISVLQNMCEMFSADILTHLNYMNNVDISVNSALFFNNIRTFYKLCRMKLVYYSLMCAASMSNNVNKYLKYSLPYCFLNFKNYIIMKNIDNNSITLNNDIRKSERNLSILNSSISKNKDEIKKNQKRSKVYKNNYMESIFYGLIIVAVIIITMALILNSTRVSQMQSSKELLTFFLVLITIMIYVITDYFVKANYIERFTTVKKWTQKKLLKFPKEYSKGTLSYLSKSHNDSTVTIKVTGSSSALLNDYWRVFDGEYTSMWESAEKYSNLIGNSGRNDYKGEYIMIDIGETVSIIGYSLKLATLNQSPTSFRIYGTNKDSAWNNISDNSWQILDDVKDLILEDTGKMYYEHKSPLYSIFGDSSIISSPNVTPIPVKGKTNEKYYTFTNTIYEISINTDLLCDILITGGGGSGGTRNGGGGGAGSCIYLKRIVLPKGKYRFNIGRGGNAVPAGKSAPGQNGGDTIITNLDENKIIYRAKGGGGGGGGISGDGIAGLSGGNSGGSTVDSQKKALLSPLNENIPETDGFFGGYGVYGEYELNSSLYGAGGGGGGASGAGGTSIVRSNGQNATILGGSGGQGITSMITGISTSYSVGGEGGSAFPTNRSLVTYTSGLNGGSSMYGGGGKGGNTMKKLNVLNDVEADSSPTTSVELNLASEKGGDGVIIIRYNSEEKYRRSEPYRYYALVTNAINLGDMTVVPKSVKLSELELYGGYEDELSSYFGTLSGLKNVLIHNIFQMSDEDQAVLDRAAAKLAEKIQIENDNNAVIKNLQDQIANYNTSNFIDGVLDQIAKNNIEIAEQELIERRAQAVINSSNTLIESNNKTSAEIKLLQTQAETYNQELQTNISDLQNIYNSFETLLNYAPTLETSNNNIIEQKTNALSSATLLNAETMSQLNAAKIIELADKKLIATENAVLQEGASKISNLKLQLSEAKKQTQDIENEIVLLSSSIANIDALKLQLANDRLNASKAAESLAQQLFLTENAKIKANTEERIADARKEHYKNLQLLLQRKTDDNENTLNRITDINIEIQQLQTIVDDIPTYTSNYLANSSNEYNRLETERLLKIKNLQLDILNFKHNIAKLIDSIETNILNTVNDRNVSINLKKEIDKKASEIANERVKLQNYKYVVDTVLSTDTTIDDIQTKLSLNIENTMNIIANNIVMTALERENRDFTNVNNNSKIFVESSKTDLEDKRRTHKMYMLTIKFILNLFVVTILLFLFNTKFSLSQITFAAIIIYIILIILYFIEIVRMVRLNVFQSYWRKPYVARL